MELREHSKHELPQSNISPAKRQAIWSRLLGKAITEGKTILVLSFQLKKTFTRIGQSVHRDSEQSRAGQDIHGQMLQVGKKWGVFHLLWFPQEIKAHEDIYRKKPFSVLRSLKAHFCIKYLTHWQNITLLMLFLAKKKCSNSTHKFIEALFPFRCYPFEWDLNTSSRSSNLKRK